MTSWAGSAALGKIFYVSILHVSFSYALHVSTRSFVCTFHMSYMNLQEFCMCQFCLGIFVCPNVLHVSTRSCMCIFHMSYMNLREFCVCLIACIFLVCPTWIYEKFDVSILLVNFLYVLRESTRIVYVSILHVHFLYVLQVSTRSCICLFCTSYMNIQEFCMCPFCIRIFNMFNMYPQEVVYVYFVCPTWIYENLICVNFTCVFFVCPTCIH